MCAISEHAGRSHPKLPSFNDSITTKRWVSASSLGSQLSGVSLEKKVLQLLTARCIQERGATRPSTSHWQPPVSHHSPRYVVILYFPDVVYVVPKPARTINSVSGPTYLQCAQFTHPSQRWHTEAEGPLLL
jgi:hypothetical protein